MMLPLATSDMAAAQVALAVYSEAGNRIIVIMRSRPIHLRCCGFGMGSLTVPQRSVMVDDICLVILFLHF
ncbi:hypothetical protein [Burkholderia sp. BCC1047]|uniref:hypothetical protein n=1 Tax=Burkholderia sp. BCC1047 TaxID=2676299 RepID=UPI00158A350F|nr:hypothetical protein [Burkholderia sp. BCC1047]